MTLEDTGVLSESREQANFVCWIRQNKPYVKIFAVPNGGTRNVREAARMKVEGVTSGVSDLIAVFKDGSKRVFFIEMKKTKGSSTSAEQKEFLSDMQEAGHIGFIAKGCDNAIELFAYWEALTDGN